LITVWVVDADFSGDIKSENIEVEIVPYPLDSTDLDDENTGVTETIEIPERTCEENKQSYSGEKIAELREKSVLERSSR